MSCRLCFEVCDDYNSELISPCMCKGTSLFVHTRCLERWQQAAFEANRPLKAFTCQICNTTFLYPSYFKLALHRIHYYILNHIQRLCQYFIDALCSVTWEPVKFLVHSLIILATLPWGHIHLGKISLSWIGFQFPPNIALTCSGTRNPSISKTNASADVCAGDGSFLTKVLTKYNGVLLVASKHVPPESVFHRAVILLLDYSHEGARGIVLNLDRLSSSLSSSSSSSRRMLNGYEVGFGGPLERNRISVIHDCVGLNSEADFSFDSEKVFVVEYGSSSQSVNCNTLFFDVPHINRASAAAANQQLTASVRQSVRRLVNLCHNTAQRAAQSNLCNTAVQYASRMMQHIGNSLRHRNRFSPSSSPENNQHRNRNRNRDRDADGDGEGDAFTNRYDRKDGNNRNNKSTSASANSPNRSASEEVLYNFANNQYDRSNNHSNNGRLQGVSLVEAASDSEGDIYYNNNTTNTNTNTNTPSSLLSPGHMMTNIRIVQGVTLWLPSQLDGELDQGIWKIVPATHESIFPGCSVNVNVSGGGHYNSAGAASTSTATPGTSSTTGIIYDASATELWTQLIHQPAPADCPLLHDVDDEKDVSEFLGCPCSHGDNRTTALLMRLCPKNFYDAIFS